MSLKNSEQLSAAFRKLRRTIHPCRARILLCGLGCFGGVYGAAAGLLIGFMADEALSQRSYRLFYRDPARAAAPAEAGSGLAAAAAVVCIRLSPGTESIRHAIEDFCVELAGKSPGLPRGAARALPRCFAAAADEAEEKDLPVFLRLVAQSGSGAARELLGRTVYEAERMQKGRLEREDERELCRLLADSGLSREEAASARAAVFPDYRDPWLVLGVERGAGRDAIKRAFRRLSREFHPDILAARRAAQKAFSKAPAGADAAQMQPPAGPDSAAGSAGTEEDAVRFEEIREAYEALIEEAGGEEAGGQP